LSAILVIGGAGFLGTRVVKKLAEAGEEVVCMDTSLGNLGAWLKDMGVGMVQGNVVFIEEILDAIETFRVDRIINLAYIMGAESDVNLQLAIRVNVLGMNNTFEAARLMKLKRVLYASSIAYHGPQRYFGDRAVNEEDLGYLPVQTYSATKRLNEYMASKYTELYHIPMVGLRLSIVYGHGRQRGLTVWSSHFASLPAVGKPVKIPYVQTQRVNLIYVYDAAELFVRLIKVPRLNHLVYLSGGHTVTLGDLAEIVKGFIPEALIGFAPQRKELPLIHLIDSSRIESEFGARQTDLKEGILHHINEARTEAGLPLLDL